MSRPVISCNCPRGVSQVVLHLTGFLNAAVPEVAGNGGGQDIPLHADNAATPHHQSAPAPAIKRQPQHDTFAVRGI